MRAAPTLITARSNPLLVRLRKLAADPGAYRRTHELLFEGEHLCAAWLEKARGPVAQALISEAGWSIPGLRALAVQAERVAIVSPAAMAGLSGLESPAPIVFAVAALASADVAAGEPTVVLDGVQDPGNAGSILRSAAAFGFHQVVALGGTAALWSGKAMRAGMGAQFGLRLVESADEAALDELGIPLLGSSSHATQEVGSEALPWPCAWVFGHEGRGISAAVATRCVSLLRIPQPGGEESLNVAAAAAVCLYESTRRQRP